MDALKFEFYRSMSGLVDGSVASRAARLVFVDSLSQSAAARQLGCNQSIVSRACRTLSKVADRCPCCRRPWE